MQTYTYVLSPAYPPASSGVTFIQLFSTQWVGVHDVIFALSAIIFAEATNIARRWQVCKRF